MKSLFILLSALLSFSAVQAAIVSEKEVREAEVAAKKSAESKKELEEGQAYLEMTKPNQISIRFSNISGYGIGYQRNFPYGTAARVTGWYQIDEFEEFKGSENFDESKNTLYNVGIDLQKNIVQENKYRVYGFGAFGYGVKKEISIVYNNGTRERELHKENIDKVSYAAGVGMGLEYYIKYLSFDLGIGYKYQQDISTNVYVGDGGFRDNINRSTGVGVTTGLNFHF